MGNAFGNTMFIVIPALISSCSCRARWRSRQSLLMALQRRLLLVFTAGNLLPPQVIFQPLFQMYKAMPWPDF